MKWVILISYYELHSLDINNFYMYFYKYSIALVRKRGLWKQNWTSGFRNFREDNGHLRVEQITLFASVKTRPQEEIASSIYVWDHCYSEHAGVAMYKCQPASGRFYNFFFFKWSQKSRILHKMSCVLSPGNLIQIVDPTKYVCRWHLALGSSVCNFWCHSFLFILHAHKWGPRKLRKLHRLPAVDKG